jgi:hypothetical protein
MGRTIYKVELVCPACHSRFPRRSAWYTVPQQDGWCVLCGQHTDHILCMRVRPVEVLVARAARGMVGH